MLRADAGRDTRGYRARVAGVPLLTRPLLPRTLLLLDAAAALTFGAVFLLVAPELNAATVALVAAMSLPLAVRRLRPVPVSAVVLAASLTAMLLGVLTEPLTAAAYTAYTAGTAGRPRSRRFVVAAAGATVAPLPLLVVGSPSFTATPRLGPFVLGLILLGGAWSLGRAVHERRVHAARAAEQMAAAAVGEERLRIARDLHDVVTHSMGLIAVKAGVANHVLAVRPEEAHDALRVIERTSREALVEMRRMVGVLRTDEVGDLAQLAAGATAAGVEVDLDVHGVDTLPDGVARSVYRIVQESLNNVTRHAGPASCRVTVVASGREVRVEVADDGLGTRPRTPRDAAVPPGSGHGLIGMRERVAMHGGEFTAAPQPGGGFRVTVRLPLGQEVPDCATAQQGDQHATGRAGPDATGRAGSRGHAERGRA